MVTNFFQLNPTKILGKTLLHYVFEDYTKYKIYAMELLTKCQLDVNVQDSGLRTPIHYLFSGKFSQKLATSGILQLIFKRGGDLTIKDKQGNTPLDLLPLNGKELVEKLAAKYKGQPIEK